jgi:hypothetical protein
MEHVRNSSMNFDLLSELTLAAPVTAANGDSSRVRQHAAVLSQMDMEELNALAMTNHVILRAFEPLGRTLLADGNTKAAEWTANAINQEKTRIQVALTFLEQICTELEHGGCRATVIKSLDHWPDLGSDLDLYTDADSTDVVRIMSSLFKATIADRSWGDRLANKWNFVVPGLSELVEIHIGRLGQTGEQTALSRSLLARTRLMTVGTHQFRVAGPEDRIVISTLQRMYRHFYIRLCDVVDNAQLVDSGAVDFAYLRSLGSEAGLWEGIATYLVIVSEYVETYRGHGIALPSFVRDAAKFGAAQISFRRDFLRVSILPHSLNLYAAEFMKLLLNGDVRNSFRLSLLPCLATAAAIEQKITGSDKGIW